MRVQRRGLSQDLGPASASGHPDLEGPRIAAAAGKPLALAGAAARAGSEPSARRDNHRRIAQIERFFRTLKEQLLWIRHFRDLEDLRAALIEFRTRYNHQWILQRLNYRTPVQARHDFTLELQPAA